MLAARLLIISYALIGVGINTAKAGPVTWEFQGSVISMNGEGSYFSNLGIAISNTFTGKVTFDPNSPSSESTFAIDSTGTSGLTGNTQRIATPFQSQTVTFSDVVIQTAGGAVSYESAYIDERGRIDQRINANGGIAIETVNTAVDTLAAFQFDFGFSNIVDRFQAFRLVDELNGGIFGLDGFIDQPPNLDDLILGRYFAREVDGNGLQQSIDTRLTSLTAVPEPSAFLLLSLGLAGIARVGKRRHSLR